MSNEKYNKTWQEGLDQLSALPGEDATDYAVLWDGIETRLHEKKNKKNNKWYRIAAACISLVLLTMMFTSKDERALNIEPIVQNKKENKESRMPIIQDATHKDFTGKLVVSKKNINHPRQRNRTLNNPGVDILPPLGDKIAAHNTINADTLLSLSEVQPVERSRPIVFSGLRKKLPVVHVNDLEAPLPADSEVAENRDRPGFRVRLFNRDMLPVGIVSDNSLKVKLSPQN